MKLSQFLIAAFVGLSVEACSSLPQERFGNEVDTSETSQADGNAYVSDAMSLRKWETVHPETEDVFYFKTCNQVDDKTFYSMTSYECTVP